MKKQIIIIISLVIILVGMIVAGVIIKNNQNNTQTNYFANGGNSSNSTATVTGAQSTANLDVDDGDSKIDWSKYTTKNITLTDSLTISEGGIYNLTATISNGMITINTEDDIKLILNGVTITNSTGPAIYVENAENVVIELAEGTTNTLTDGSTYSNTELNGCIYSSADLIFQGKGILVVNAYYQDGIVSKDDLKIIEGTYKINAVDDGIRGKDSVYIIDGNFDITTAEGDGIKSTNDEDEDKGFVYIKNGTINISAYKQAIEAIKCVQIDNGNINITKSKEGIESRIIIINDGNINIVSSDDGINISSMLDDSSSSTNPMQVNISTEQNQILTINGGNITITASGDSIDLNGGGYMTGGNLVIYGTTNSGNGILDYDLNFNVTGGNIVAGGGSGMFQSLSSDSTLNNISIIFSSTISANSSIVITNSSGEEIVSYTPKTSINALIVASNKLQKGETYIVKVNGTENITFTVNNTQTTVGNAQNLGMGEMMNRGERR